MSEENEKNGVPFDHVWKCPNCGLVNLNVDICQGCAYWPAENESG